MVVKDHLVVIEHLRVLSGDSTISIEGTFENFFSGPLEGQLHVTSPALVMDEILSCLETMENTEEMDQDEDPGEEGGEGNGVLKSFFLEGVNIDTDLVIDRISYGNLGIADVKATCVIHDNTVDLQSVQGALGDGLLQGKGRIALGIEGLDFSSYLTGNNLQLNTMVDAVSPGVKGDFRGFTDFTVNLSGNGITEESFKKNLTGEGEIQVKNGTVSDLEFLQSLSSFIKVDKLDTLTFDHSHGTFRVADGLIHTTSSLKGKEIELYPEGTISLDAYVNLALKMRISPSLSEQIVDGVLTKYFIDEKGWTVLDLAIKGPSDEVVVMPASSTIKSISEMFVDILLKKEESDSAEREDKKEALEELLEKLMKRSEGDTPLQKENTPAAQ
jgi:AsmA protein